MTKADDLRREGNTTCPTCGQKLAKLNPHKMDKAKIRVLEAMAKIGGWVFTAHDKAIRAGEQEYPTLQDSRVHAQRLFYFGLVDYMGKRTGTYKANEKGISFLCGKTSVSEKIWVRRSPDGGAAVEEESEEKIFVHQAKGVVLDRSYWDNYAGEQR